MRSELMLTMTDEEAFLIFSTRKPISSLHRAADPTQQFIVERSAPTAFILLSLISSNGINT
jgi:hypothetical protein